jgi:ATP-dependent helicase Lhr and Lhr-like helicase
MNRQIEKKSGYDLINRWFAKKQWEPFDYQKDTWDAFLNGKSGLLNAPTGSGKTYALWVPAVLELLQQIKNDKIPIGLRVIWITPLRALAKDLQKALQLFIDDIGLKLSVELRTGDTSVAARSQQLKSAPTCLITTPESLHILFSQSQSTIFFNSVSCIIVDEWHELLSTKRGVQTELAISRIRGLSKNKLKIWGVSATIGNLDEALKTLLGAKAMSESVIIKANIKKTTEIQTILPDIIERFPWHGHLGLTLLTKILPIIDASKTTLLFTNTRSQTELWYRAILNEKPEYAGIIAMHHGSIDGQMRIWVEEALRAGKLKLVVCTSSLDLGVDFRPVETIFQIGGPKGISRFLQRAGRSGHAPGETSKIYFVPTHSLELVEGAALKMAEKKGIHESRTPLEKPLDVLVQYLVTLSVGPGFESIRTLKELKETHAYKDLTEKEWNWALEFITSGGRSLSNYSEYSKVEVNENVFTVESRRVKTRHRLSIGTIVGDPVLNVRLKSGGYLGTIEESFINTLNIGDVFWFGGRPLEFMQLKDMTVYVKKSNRKGGKIPVWGGGRLPLSSRLSELIKEKLDDASNSTYDETEMVKVKPLLELQKKWSDLPGKKKLLIEKIETTSGFHIFIYPFEGRFVHEILSALLAYRISKIRPFSFSLAMNDYGFELLSDQDIPIEEALELDLFSVDNLMEDIELCINHSGLAKMKFRDIATISGLVFKGYPGKIVSNKHLQSSSSLLYEVFNQYDPSNLLIRQAKEEVITLELDYKRLIDTLIKINGQEIVLKYPEKITPFAFPIMADRLRQKLTTENITDRLLKLRRALEKAAG